MTTRWIKPRTVRMKYAKKKKRKLKRQNPLKTLLNTISPFTIQWTTANSIAKRAIISIMIQNNDFPQIVTIRK
jgi:hypothetical protein